MGGKKSLTLRFDAPVILVYCAFSFLILILDEFVFKNSGLVQKIFSLPGTLSKSAAADASELSEALGTVVQTEGVFNFQNPVHYLRLIFYIFGNRTLLQFLLSFAFILPLGIQMEEIYGSPAIGVMILITTLVAGVLNACMIPATLCGAGAICFMLILLSSITSLSKNELPISAIFIFALYIGSEFYLNGIMNNTKVVAIFAKLAGGLAASMIGFLTAPKTRRASSAKNSASSNFSSSNFNKSGSYGESDATKQARQSFMDRIRQEKAKKKFDDETTVIGSVNI